jgi:hypothetical protein
MNAACDSTRYVDGQIFFCYQLINHWGPHRAYFQWVNLNDPRTFKEQLLHPEPETRSEDVNADTVSDASPKTNRKDS